MAKVIGLRSRMEHDKDKYKCEPCSFDEKTERATGFCGTCVEYMCKNCLKHHRKTKVTRGHVLLEDTIPTNARSFQLLRESVECSNHPGRLVEYKCEDHDKLICIACEMKTHRECKHVTELNDMINETVHKESGKVLQDNIHLIEQKINSFKQKNVNNIAAIDKDSRKITLESKAYVQKIECKLTQLGAHHSLSVEETAQTEIKRIRTNIEKTDLKVKQQNELIDLLETTLQHGNPKQIKVVLKTVTKQLQHLREEVDELDIDRETSLIFKPNNCLLDIPDLGIVSLIRRAHNEYRDGTYADIANDSKYDEVDDGTVVRFCEGRQIKADTVSCEIELSDKTIKCENVTACVIDEKHKSVGNETGLCTMPCKDLEKSLAQTNRKATSISTKKEDSICQREPLLLRNLESVGDYNIKLPGDMESCSIFGCSVLPDGRFVFIDNTNRKIKLYNKQFGFIRQSNLTYSPCGICVLEDTVVAITYSDKKRISRYIIRNNKIEYDHGFTIDGIGRSVTRYLCTSIAILCVDEENGTNDTEIQIREMSSGEIIRRLNQFIDLNGSAVRFKDPRCILYKHGGSNLFICDNSQFRCFDPNGKLRWFYQSGRDKAIKHAVGADLDNEGNIYVCGKSSGNIHQINSIDCKDYRVLLHNIHAACVVTFDALGERLVVGCDGDTNIHVFKFV